MRICLYEDDGTSNLFPLTLTRTASDLLCGLTPLGEKQVRHFAPEVVGHLCRPTLADWLRVHASPSPVNDPAWLRAAPTVLVNARWLPPHSFSPSHRVLFAEGPFVALAGNRIAYAVLDPRRLQSLAPGTVDDCLRDWVQTLPCRAVGGAVIDSIEDLLDRNGAELTHDFEAICDPTEAGYHPTGFALVGLADRLFVHPSAQVDPFVVADTTRGPVVVAEGAIVTAFTRLEGPCGVGRYAQVLGATVRGGTTIGPHCRVGGEVCRSIFLDHAAKAHEGYLGESYLGEWVTLGAGTCSSDVDHEPIRIGGSKSSTDGRGKATVFGDHAKTGPGVLLDRGTVVGSFADVLPTGTYAPRTVAPFHRVGPEGVRELEAESLVSSAAERVKKHGFDLGSQQEAVYRSIGLNGASVPVTEGPVTLQLRKSA